MNSSFKKYIFMTLFICIMIFQFSEMPVFAQAESWEEFPSECAFTGEEQFVDDGEALLPIAEYEPLASAKAEIKFSKPSEDPESEEETVIFTPTTLGELAESELLITPPEGYFIKALYLIDNNFNGEKNKNLLDYFAASKDSAAVSVKCDTFADYKEYFLCGDNENPGAFHFYLVLAEITGIPHAEYSSDRIPCSELGIESEDEDVEIDSEFSLPFLSEDKSLDIIKEYHSLFEGWDIKFPNGSHIVITESDSDSFIPYTGFKATPVLTDVKTVIISDKTDTFNGYVPVLPEDISTYNSLYNFDESALAMLELGDFADSGEAGVISAPIQLTSLSYQTEDGPVELNAEEIAAADDIYIFNGKYTVSKAPLIITAGSAQRAFDNSPLSCNEFQADSPVADNVVSCTVSGELTSIGVTPNIPSNAVITVSAEDLTDVTRFYSITYVNGQLTVSPSDEKIKITIKPKDVNCAYTGHDITPEASGCEYFSITGELLDGDSIKEVYTDATPISEGSAYFSIIGYKVYRGDYELASAGDYYDISTTGTGMLTLSKLALTIKADSASKEFDGTALIKNSYTISSGELRDGDTLKTVEIKPSTDLIYVGKTVNNASKAVIVDADNNDVTALYDISYSSGKLEVIRRNLTITVGNVSKDYTGSAQWLGKDDISSTPLPADCELTIKPTRSLTDVGTVDIGVTVVSITEKNSQKDIKDQFNIKTVDGKLTIVPRLLIIETKSASKNYDGTPLTERSLPVVTGKLEGDKISIKFTGSQTKVGVSSNTCEVTGIVDSNNRDVTNNYDIQYMFGNLEVKSASGSGSGNGTPSTGDPNNPYIWITIMAVCAVGIVVIVIINSIKKSRKKH